MFKKVTKIALAGIIGIGTLVGSSSFASAEYKSKANVEFSENIDPTKPVDPTDPTKPVEPDEEVNDGTAGPLSIDYVSNFNFGTQKTSGNKQTYPALAVTLNGETKTVAPYAQVTDNRGTHAGWNLKVAQPKELSYGEGPEEVLLEGATITIGKGSVVTGTSENKELIKAAEDITLSDEEQIVFSAADEAKGGTWVNSFGSAEEINIELTIPAGTKIVQGETYTTELNWTLEDIPLD